MCGSLDCLNQTDSMCFPQQFIQHNYNMSELTEYKQFSEQPNNQPDHIERLTKENARLKSNNQKLRSILNEMEQKLEVQINRKITQSNAKNYEVLSRKLENAYKQLEIQTKQNRRLQRKTNNHTKQKVQELNAQLILKEKQIDALKEQIKTLRKIKAFHEKSLVEVAGNGVVQCYKDNQMLQEEIKRLESRHDNFQRQFKRKSMSSQIMQESKPQETNIADEGLYERQAQMIKKYEHQIRKFGLQRTRLKQDIQQLLTKIVDKDKQIQSLKLRIQQNKIIPRIKINKQNLLQPIRIKTYESVEEFSNLQSTKHKNSRSINKSRLFEQSNKRVVTTKVYKPSYPKIEERGVTNPKAIKFNDHQYSSKIIGMFILIDNQHRIQDIRAKYEKGVPERLVKDKEYTSFQCVESQFIQYISGGFSDDELEFLVLVTNNKRLMKFGVEKPQCKKFDFNITEDQYPAALLGQVMHGLNNTYSVNRFGCLIERIP